MKARAPAAALVVFALAACGIDAVGTAPPLPTSALPDASPAVDGAPRDSGPGCRSITTGKPGSLVAPKVAAAPTIDGDLSDWSSCFVSFDRDTAYSVRDLVGGGNFVSGEFSIVHDGTKIYVAARIKGVAPLGGNTGPEIYENDSAEIYFDADNATAQTYGADTTQIVVDHAGRRQGYRMSQVTDTPSASSAARVDADGVTFSLELEVSPATFGRATFPNVVGFDIAMNNGSGSDQLSQIIWFQKCRKSSGCGCADGNDAPYCDARQFGEVMLAP